MTEQPIPTIRPTADDYARAQKLIDGIRERGAQVEGVAVVIAAIRAAGFEAGLAAARADEQIEALQTGIGDDERVDW